jgi:phosphoenolpyruvate synthase/pyruvate phosphate dikinase
MNKKQKSEEEKEMLEWYGLPKTKTYEEVFEFNLNEVNEVLLESFKPY